LSPFPENFSADALALKKWLMTLVLQPATPQEQKHNLLIKRLAHINFAPFFVYHLFCF